MTKEELIAEYGEHNVFNNQFEMAKFIQEYGIRHHFKKFETRYPNELFKKDPENYYDLAEDLLKKGLAFFNDGYYIVEDLEDVENI